MTHNEILLHSLVPTKIFYGTLIVILLFLLVIGVSLVISTERFSNLMIGVGEVLLGFIGALYMVIKYRVEMGR